MHATTMWSNTPPGHHDQCHLVLGNTAVKRFPVTTVLRLLQIPVVPIAGVKAASFSQVEFTHSL